MDKSSCDAYIYAKVSSRISKAFSGKDSEKLFAVKSLSELYGLLFNEEVPSIPESLLAREIEIKSERKFGFSGSLYGITPFSHVDRTTFVSSAAAYVGKAVLIRIIE